MFTRQLGVLISSGTPVVDALAALERQTKQGLWRNTITDIRTQIEEGSPLSEALENHPGYFDPVFRSLIAAGESGGSLPAMLDRLAVVVRKRLHVRSSVLAALIYPSLLVVVAVTVFVLMLAYVVPRFAELFDTLDVPLPPSTRALIVASGLLRTYWWAMAGAAIAGAVALRTYLVSPAGRRFRDTAILRLPRIGGIVRNFITARIARLLGALLEGHVPVQDALRLTRESAGNHHYAELIGRAEDAVTRGEAMSAAFAGSALVSPSVCEAIRSGEQNGQVGSLLVGVAEFLDEENEVVLRSLTSIIEPLILILLGLLVGFVALSLFMPMFDLTAMTQ